MAQSPKYLGIGIQRKGKNLDNVIVGWFTYQKTSEGLQLYFAGKDSPDLQGALDQCFKLIGQADSFHCYYSGRGQGYYIEQEYYAKHGRPDENKGRFQLYEEEGVSDDDESYTRLAWDVHRLRRVEMEWPSKQFTTPWKNLRPQLRNCELNDEPGRGPLRRFLSATQKEMQTEWVPVAAMAFQALRLGWSEMDEQGTYRGELLSSYTSAAGTPPIGMLRYMIPKDEEWAELDDPQYAFQEDGGGEPSGLMSGGEALY